MKVFITFIVSKDKISHNNVKLLAQLDKYPLYKEVVSVGSQRFPQSAVSYVPLGVMCSHPLNDLLAIVSVKILS